MKIDKFPTTVLDFADAINEHEDRIAYLEKRMKSHKHETNHGRTSAPEPDKERFECRVCGEEMTPNTHPRHSRHWWRCLSCGLETGERDTPEQALSDVRALQK